MEVSRHMVKQKVALKDVERNLETFKKDVRNIDKTLIKAREEIMAEDSHEDLFKDFLKE